MRRRELERRLRDVRVPEEERARERSWRLVRSAWAERPAPPRRARPAVRLALVFAGAALLLALALSPAGARVAELIDEAFQGAEDPRPELTELPTEGRLLVTSSQGPWIVEPDGSKRLLGDYEEATWSPSGLFVAVAEGRELTAVVGDAEQVGSPVGTVRWSLARGREISDPRWFAPSGFRIAYRAGDSLRVVAGDGTGDHLLAREVAPVAAAWRPPREERGAPPHVLAYVDGAGAVRVRDADSGGKLWRARPRTGEVSELAWIRQPGTAPPLLLALTPSGLEAFGPGGVPAFVRELPAGTRAVEIAASTRGRVALIRRRGRGAAGESELVTLDVRDPGASERRLLQGPGHLRGLSFAPNGRWLVVGWEEPDQWLFLRPGRGSRTRRTIAIADASAQFAPGARSPGALPTVAGWCCPQAGVR